MNRISCLIIDTDQEAIRHIDILGRTIGSLEVRWKTNSLETGVAIIRKHLPEMAIVGLGQNPSASIEAVSALSRDFPTLYLLALSEKSDSDLILRAMRAGAHDFLCKPIKEIDLRAAVEKVYKLKAARMEKRPDSGRIVSVFSNKGGNGTTTIAVNLADALVRYHGKKVAVVGAGPAGLSCAHRLASWGHSVTVFDKNGKAGGLNEYGIAAYKALNDIAQKEVDYIQAPFGIVGLETAIGLTISELVEQKFLTLSQMVEKLSTNPRRIIGREINVKEGERANLTFIDPLIEWNVEPGKFKSKSKNSPFGGRPLKGKAVGVFNNGRMLLY